ncbi:hypothetical protein [Haloparvum sp. PAK95]|uniref:hypothetical protein n=1 Tax=Haloparvum sp. PAK95 TaxID=3418962 RepID=UPI003D2F295F
MPTSAISSVGQDDVRVPVDDPGVREASDSRQVEDRLHDVHRDDQQPEPFQEEQRGENQREPARTSEAFRRTCLATSPTWHPRIPPETRFRATTVGIQIYL